ncbi:heteroglycan glucosidase 1 [Abeliophyllum distichum]
METLRYFLFDICGVTAGWKMEDVLEEELKIIKDTVGPDDHVICALSGGVDSTVAATLVHKAIGDRLHCAFVDNGLLRFKERERVTETFEKDLHLPVTCIDATGQFLSKLKVSSLKGKFLLAGFLDVQSAENGHSFGGLSDATPKLFGRWMGVGALFPFCRGHSETDTIDHEPWSFREECEEVCRLALRRRHWLLPHLYNLFYLAHTRGIPVATHTFSTDPKDFDLRTHENSFLLGPLLVYASTRNDDQELYQIQHKLPKGMWLSFDFEDSHPDLPSLYLKGGSIIPLAPPYQHVDEANPTDDISLLVALDEHVELQVMLTAESANKGSELSRTPVEIKSGDWALKVVPWMGGTQWLHSRVDVIGYEE